jgi:hypothetical protein
VNWPFGTPARRAFPAALVALVAFLPFLRGALSGASLYFRDLAVHFLPLRRFALEGLLAGEVRLWNPLVHEGIPLSLPTLGYPPDLLQLLRPDEFGISLVLAIHVPLAAIAFLAMARGFSLPAAAAAGGALVYALGGFLLSTVNLYVYLQAAAWAPLLVLGLARDDPPGQRRGLALAAAALAVGLSTTGIEVVAQAVLIGVALGWRRLVSPGAGRRLLGLTATLALAAAMAAPVLLLVAGQIEGSARGRGLPTEVVLAHSVHPFTLVQVVVGGLYGNLGNLANEWWGQNFFPRGFPYVLSLYLGAAALALAAVGATSGRRMSGTLVALAAFALVVALGRWSGLAPLVDAVPVLRLFRFPVKAFFTVHFAVSLLAALGIAALVDGSPRRAWHRLGAWAGALGGLLVLGMTLPSVLPGPLATFGARFFPPGHDAATRSLLMGRVLTDAAAGGLAALLLCATAFLVLRGALAPSRGAGLVIAVATADLLRAGAGLNPMVSTSFFAPSPELSSALPVLREGRVFTCALEESPAYRAAREARRFDHELWSFASLQETLTPFSNLRLGVATALSPDLTMLVPQERVLSPDEASCRDLDRILPRLREAGVRRVVSTSVLSHPDLVHERTLRPARAAPLEVRVYAVEGPLPLLRVVASASGGAAIAGRVSAEIRSAGRIEAVVEADQPATLIVGEGWSPGWRARVDGRSVDVGLAPGARCAVVVPRGRSRVLMRFWPPGLIPALAMSVLGLAATLGLLWPGRRRRPSVV